MDHADIDGNTALFLADQSMHYAVVPLLRHWSLTVPRRLATYACVARAIDLEEGRAS